MATLLEFVESIMKDRSSDFSRNRMTWDVVCWDFGLKHEQGTLVRSLCISVSNAYLAAL